MTAIHPIFASLVAANNALALSVGATPVLGAFAPVAPPVTDDRERDDKTSPEIRHAQQCEGDAD